MKKSIKMSRLDLESKYVAPDCKVLAAIPSHIILISGGGLQNLDNNDVVAEDDFIID